MDRNIVRTACCALALLCVLDMTLVAQAQTPTPPIPTPVSNPWGLAPTPQPINVPTLSPAVIQPAIDALSTVQAQAASISTTVGLSYTLPTTLTISGANPFSMVRGFAYMMGEVAWLQALFTFFTTSLVLMVAVMMIRLIVSMWGVIRRLIEVIRLIIPLK